MDQWRPSSRRLISPASRSSNESLRRYSPITGPKPEEKQEKALNRQYDFELAEPYSSNQLSSQFSFETVKKAIPEVKQTGNTEDWPSELIYTSSHRPRRIGSPPPLSIIAREKQRIPEEKWARYTEDWPSELIYTSSHRPRRIGSPPPLSITPEEQPIPEEKQAKYTEDWPSELIYTSSHRPRRIGSPPPLSITPEKQPIPEEKQDNTTIMKKVFYTCTDVLDYVFETWPTLPTRRSNNLYSRNLFTSRAQENQATFGYVNRRKSALCSYDKLQKKGFLLVINFMFTGKLERKGSDDDVGKLCKFFTNLKYDVDCRVDMTTEELRTCLENVRHNYLSRDSSKYHCFICVIMSHGNERGISTMDGKIEMDDIVHYFKNDQLKKFIGKPKVFIVQSCRGDAIQQKQKYERNQRIVQFDSSSQLNRLPTEADILKIYATTPGHSAHRRSGTNTWNGSWLINAFLDTAKQNPELHVDEMMTAVRRLLSTNPDYEYDGEKCQIAVSETTLTKLFYL